MTTHPPTTDIEEATVQRDNHLTKLKNRILCLKKTVHASNAILLSFAALVFLTYLYTPLFDGMKDRDALRSCARAEIRFQAFQQCAAYCSPSDGDGDGVNPVTIDPDPSCGPIATILSEARTVELEGVCSQEALLSTGGGGDGGGVLGGGTVECGKRCRISKCCWKRGLGGCAEKQRKMCDVYLPCAILYVDPMEFGMGIGPVIYEGVGVENKDYP